MIGIPTRCVVDTNVATTANGANSEAGASCIAASAKALQTIMSSGHVFVDQGGLIVREYRANLKAKGQPGPGDAYFKWLLTHEWGGHRVTRVSITQRDDDPDDFDEVPAAPVGIIYDRSDRKFLAVAAAHLEHPPILQSFDSKWWGWQKSLQEVGITIHFICPEEIQEKHRRKMGSG